MLKPCFLIKSFVIRTFHKSSVLNAMLRDSANAKLSKTVLDRYISLPIPDCKTLVRYVWIDRTNCQCRSKSRTLQYTPACYKEVPNWGFNGHQIGMTSIQDSTMTLVPIALYNDPIRRGSHKIALCEVYDKDLKPSPTNHRQKCVDAVNESFEQFVLFGFEQEYILMDTDGRPFGWPAPLGEAAHTDLFYCGVGATKTYGREITEAHYRACLYAGVEMYGVNSESVQSQWEFQTGPTSGIKACDDLWMARYLLYLVAEDFGVYISLNPKMFLHLKGSALNANMSTKAMRDSPDDPNIENSIVKRLRKNHLQCIKRYDIDGRNVLRLTGNHETCVATKFVAGDTYDRSASIRYHKGKGNGFFEDRRPPSNGDPYIIMDALIRTVCLNEIF